MAEKVLMKGNEAIAYAAINCGADGYFGYPITPQSEVMETLMKEKPWETTGMVVLQAESEVASINMVYGGAATGKRVMTSSSSPGISLMQEGISYMAGAELPALIVNVSRGGPGLGTIQPSQADYFQTVKGGGHGDYRLITLAPASVQEMADFVDLAFELAFKYRNPAMIAASAMASLPFINTFSAIFSPYLSTVMTQSGHISAHDAQPPQASWSVTSAG
jgi:2-oxoglutarate ferredoxin oxidoreductase subunit alpha